MDLHRDLCDQTISNAVVEMPGRNEFEDSLRFEGLINWSDVDRLSTL